jgi:hypothetical protein
MTAQDDQNFYEHKERLLRYVRAGTATWEQKDWLKRWGFLDKPQPPKKAEWTLGIPYHLFGIVNNSFVPYCFPSTTLISSSVNPYNR